MRWGVGVGLVLLVGCVSTAPRRQCTTPPPPPPPSFPIAQYDLSLVGLRPMRAHEHQLICTQQGHEWDLASESCSNTPEPPQLPEGVTIRATTSDQGPRQSVRVEVLWQGEVPGLRRRLVEIFETEVTRYEAVLGLARSFDASGARAVANWSADSSDATEFLGITLQLLEGRSILSVEREVQQRPIDDPIGLPSHRPEGRRLFSAGVDLAAGAQRADIPLDHIAFATGLRLDYLLAGPLALGVDGWMIAGGDAGVDTNGDGIDDANGPNLIALAPMAGPRLLTTGLGGWRFGLSAGYLGVVRSDASSGPLVGASISRMIWADGAIAGLFIRGLQGAGPTKDYRALLVGTTLGFQGGDVQLQYPRRDPLPYGFGVEMMVTGFNLTRTPALMVPPGMGFHVAAPLGHALDLRVRFDFLGMPGGDDDGVLLYSAMGGARLRLTAWAPIFVEALAGWGATFGTQPARIGDGPILDVAAGYHFVETKRADRPSNALHAGLRARIGLSDDNDELRSLMIIAGYEYGSRGGAIGGYAPSTDVCIPRERVEPLWDVVRAERRSALETLITGR